MPRGSVILVGGHEKKRGRRTILQRFVQECGGHGCRVAVIGVASEEPRAVRSGYEDAFDDLGARVLFLELPDRGTANGSEPATALRRCDGAFFSGGDQLRITSLVGGTRTERAIRDLWESGSPIGGTSAGASAMSATMIVDGREDATPALLTIHMAPGLGLLPQAVVDPHFAQRGRTGRLLSALAQNPAVLGIGLDEDTALVIKDETGEVLGSNTVTFLDASQAAESNASEARSAALALTDVCLHVLPSGYRFDMQARRPLGTSPQRSPGDNVDVRGAVLHEDGVASPRGGVADSRPSRAGAGARG